MIKKIVIQLHLPDRANVTALIEEGGKKQLVHSRLLLPGAFQRQHFRVVALKRVAMRQVTRKTVPEL